MSTPIPLPLVVIDSNVWISRIQAADSRHGPAKVWTDNHLASGGLLIAPTILLIEVGSVIARNTQRQADGRKAIMQIRSLPFLQLVDIDTSLVYDACDMAIGFGLASADSLFAAVAARLNIPLVTFDQDLQKKVKTRLTIIQP